MFPNVLEKFPGLNVRTGSPDNNDTECVRCIQDKRTPKLYSSMNNMDPGPVPPELLVAPNLSKPLLPLHTGYYSITLYIWILPSQFTLLVCTTLKETSTFKLHN